MNNPKLSVIIPVYNAENTIRRCLDSIINQTFHDWECLCINDGSTDNSGGVITEYANRDKRIKLLTQANGGVSSARNLGILHASGEWITFIDSDDAIAPAYFDIIETNDVDMILGAYESSKDNVTRHIASGFYSGRKLKRLFRDNVHILLMRVPWAKFCKRRLLQDLRFDQTLRLGEDTVFFHQYYKRCSSVLVDERPCYLYRGVL